MLWTDGDRTDLDFDGAFASYHPALFRYLFRITGDADAAADIAQESFVRLLDQRRVPNDKVRSWLFTVATNLVRDQARTRERRHRLLRGQVPGASAPGRPDEELERDEEIESVRRALDRLEPRDRQLLMLREEGFRYVEIAEMVGIAPGSVGKLLSRALERFARTHGSRAADSRNVERESRG